MNSDKNKKQQLKDLKPKKYKVYGIFNFQLEKLVYIDLDADKVVFEFEIEGYKLDEYDIVSFDILLS